MITSEEIKARLWNGANELRGSMDASRYKDYMLGLMFYKFLSDQTLRTFATTAGISNEEDWFAEYKNAHNEYGTELEKMTQDILGYFVRPKHLYQTWVQDMNAGTFEVQEVTESLNQFERSIAVTNDSDDFKGLFSSSTLDLTDTALGSNLNERSNNIQALIRLFEDNEELVPGHLSADMDFDIAFNAWQENRQMNRIDEFATEWGLEITKSL